MGISINLGGIPKHTLFDVNTSNKYYTGSMWDTHKGTTLVILGKVKSINNSYISNKTPKYRVGLESGAILILPSTSISSGNIKDPYFPSVKGKGYMGQGIFSQRDCPSEYMLWHSMLSRCYGNPKYHPSYVDCYVSDRWHNFQLFCRDLFLLPKYSIWKEGTIKKINKKNPMELDKDTLIPGNKIYSKDTCTFILNKENSREANLRNIESIISNNLTGKVYKAKKATGDIITFTNIKAFSKEYNLPSSDVGQCLKGRSSHVKEWFFWERHETDPYYIPLNILVIEAKNPSKELSHFLNIVKFSRENNLSAGCISYCLKGKQKYHRGWEFNKIKLKDTLLLDNKKC